MRIAVLILGLLFNIVLFIQTILFGGLGDAVGDETTAQAGAVGVLVSLLWLVASALVLAFPIVSVVLFTLAGVLGFAVSGDFPDMAVWGSIALVLAVMSFFGWRGKRKDAREKAAERQRERERDDRLEGLLRQQHLHQQQSATAHTQQVGRQGAVCASCGATNGLTSKFCAECGAPMAVVTR